MDLPALRDLIRDRIEARIESAPVDGISAEGDYSERLLYEQRSYVDGLRSGRLAALAAIDEAIEASEQ